jgi:hypothetical protein
MCFKNHPLIHTFWLDFECYFNPIQATMHSKLSLLLFLTLFILLGCEKKNTPSDNPNQSSPPDDACEAQAISEGKVFYKDDTRFLYGGTEDDWHFEIDNLDLDLCRLSNGLGRESFQALLVPEYVPVSDYSEDFRDKERTIVVFSDDGPKAYPISLVRDYEVVNDVIEGEPVAIVYCVLANFFRVYSRRVCDTVFTFALSGYTYNDPNIRDGRDGFVWWDRETESLWWPLINEAVSGKMKGADLEVFPQGEWTEIYWKDVLEMYPEARVLKRGQTMEPPENWPAFEENPCFN